MHARDATVPVVWLAGYLGLLSIFHYEWIRRWHPTRGGGAAKWLLCGLLVFGFCVSARVFRAAWFNTAAFGVTVALSTILFIAGYRLHRRIEVHS